MNKHMMHIILYAPTPNAREVLVTAAEQDGIDNFHVAADLEDVRLSAGSGIYQTVWVMGKQTEEVFRRLQITEHLPIRVIP